MRSGQQQAFVRTPPREARDAKCANCNQTGHTAQVCKQKKLTMGERKCHICDKSGHLARVCPDRDKSKRANMIDEEPLGAQGPQRLGMVQHAHKKGLTRGEVLVQKAKLTQRQKKIADETWTCAP